MSHRVLLALVLVLATPLTADGATVPTYTWSMDVTGANVTDNTGTRVMSLTGTWLSTPGRSGGAVEFTTAPSVGSVLGSAADNPGTANFAMGVVFTSRPVPAKKYAGNVVQKGLFGDPGQIKLQIVPAYGGSNNCRIKGTNGARLISSTVNIDDGNWHYAVCWREGAQVGITVDGVTTSVTWDPGSVSNTQLVMVGNRRATKAGANDQHFGRNDCTVYTIGPTARMDAVTLLGMSC
jgi:hypothetical protein